ncbi:MAG: ComF family protein [Gammaproteobacteria bacterium]
MALAGAMGSLWSAKTLAGAIGGLLSAKALVGSVLMPPTCCLCAAAGQMPDLDLCEVCSMLLPVNRDAPVDVAANWPAFARVLVPFEYAYPVDHLIRALKFRGERVYARVLGTLLAQAHQAVRQELPNLIVPMPLHSARYRERGFNQAQEIARFAARRLGVAVDTRSLLRKVATQEQSGLSLAERRMNVRGAFEGARGLQGKRVALVDDVLTTGSTALAASTALLAAGVTEVELWAVARVALAALKDPPPSRPAVECC